MQPADYFKQIPLFCDLNADEIMDVLRIARVVSFKAGSKLCTRGAAADCAYLLEQGEVSIRASEDGKPEVELARAGAGELLGELALIDGHPRSADVIALTEVRGYRIDRSELDAMRRAMHPAAFKILRRIAITVSDRLRDLNDAISEELAKSAPSAAERATAGSARTSLAHARSEPEPPAPSRAAARVSREFARTSRELGRVSHAPARVSKAAPAPAPRASRASKAAPQPQPQPAARASKAAPQPASQSTAEPPSFWRSMLDRLGGTSLK